MLTGFPSARRLSYAKARDIRLFSFSPRRARRQRRHAFSLASSQKPYAADDKAPLRGDLITLRFKEAVFYFLFIATFRWAMQPDETCARPIQDAAKHIHADNDMGQYVTSPAVDARRALGRVKNTCNARRSATATAYSSHGRD